MASKLRIIFIFKCWGIHIFPTSYALHLVFPLFIEKDSLIIGMWTRTRTRYWRFDLSLSSWASAFWLRATFWWKRSRRIRIMTLACIFSATSISFIRIPKGIVTILTTTIFTWLYGVIITWFASFFGRVHRTLWRMRLPPTWTTSCIASKNKQSQYYKIHWRTYFFKNITEFF